MTSLPVPRGEGEGRMWEKLEEEEEEERQRRLWPKTSAPSCRTTVALQAEEEEEEEDVSQTSVKLTVAHSDRCTLGCA